MKLFSILAVTAIAANFPLQAADTKVWNTSAELGAITTSGNTVGTSVTGKIDARQELERWSNQYIFSVYFKEDEKTNADGVSIKERSAERYQISAKGAYKLNQEHDNLFVIGSHTDDKFGAFATYSTLAVGYGTRLYNAEHHSLDVEIGPGFFSGKRANDDTDQGLIARGAASYKWQLSESAAFTQTLSIEYGDDNTRTVAESAISARINNAMQMKAAFLVQNDSDVPINKKRTDTQTSLTLVYSF